MKKHLGFALLGGMLLMGCATEEPAPAPQPAPPPVAMPMSMATPMPCPYGMHHDMHRHMHHGEKAGMYHKCPCHEVKGKLVTKSGKPCPQKSRKACMKLCAKMRAQGQTAPVVLAPGANIGEVK